MTELNQELDQKQNQDFNINNLLEPINIDFDKLFSLSYTFDNLKTFMKNILKNQQIIADKINDLEKKSLNQNDENKKAHIFQVKIDKRVKTVENNVSKNKKVLDNLKSNIKEVDNAIKEIEENNVTESDDKENPDKRPSKKRISRIKRRSTYKENESSFNEENEDKDEKEYDYENYPDMASNKDISEIKNRLDNLEQKLEELNMKAIQKPVVTLNANDFQVSDKNNDVDLIKLEIKNIKQNNESFKMEADIIKKKIEDISVKVMDFDVYDVFKDSSVGGGSVDAAKILIKNLEQKLTHKNEIIDEKIKKNEEDIYKLKNEFQNLKNESDVISYNLNSFQDKIKELVEQVGLTNDTNSNLVNDINGKLTETYKKLLEKINEEKTDLKKSIEKIKRQLKLISNNKNIDEEVSKSKGNVLSDEDLKLISDLTKRMNEAEKTIKNLISISPEISKTKERIIKVENNLTLKANQTDFDEYVKKLTEQINMNNNIREFSEKTQDLATKNMKDLSFLMNKIESLGATVLAMKEALETLSGMKQENIFDMTQYVENIAFQDFIKRNNKDKDKLERGIDELRRLFKDILEAFNKKADEKDLKDFETLLNNKLEELKLMSGKKFADKIDTGKTLKYLDTQIKYILDILNKKNDRNENWLIAKKPIGGHACASCESYLGDLKENDDYVAWNKYPQREHDKNYRVGNGFSRMLNMLNLDIKNTFEGIKENNYDSDNEHLNFDKKRLMTSPVNNTINTQNNSRNNKNNNFNRSTLNNFGPNNALPKINIALSKDDGNIKDKNFNASSLQMTNKSMNVKNNVDKNKLNIVKVFKK